MNLACKQTFAELFFFKLCMHNQSHHMICQVVLFKIVKMLFSWCSHYFYLPLNTLIKVLTCTRCVKDESCICFVTWSDQSISFGWDLLCLGIYNDSCDGLVTKKVITLLCLFFFCWIYLCVIHTNPWIVYRSSDHSKMTDIDGTAGTNETTNNNWWCWEFFKLLFQEIVFLV